MKKHLAFILSIACIVWAPLVIAQTTSDTITLEGEVTQVFFPQELPVEGLHICLSYLRTINGTVALVEDSSSCHYARRFRHQIGSWAHATEPAESYVQDESLKNVLERVAPKATFFILEIE
ncbi:MAG: hypothetical protein HYV97_08390 [Bdellovibrio sp.]|nr:hypothetical protein [Bdellovibrio sp.]